MKGILFLVLGFFCVSCGGSSADDTGDETDDGTNLEATLSSIQENIFTPTCATSGCHASTAASGELSLAEGESFGELVSIASSQATDLNRVQPSDPDSSYLLNKLLGTQADVGGSGSDMPKGGSALSDDEISAIQEWIEDGALDN